MQQKSNDVWETKEIKVISERNYGRDGLLVLRVVQYVKNGQKLGGPKLELREYYTDKQGIRKMGKMKGLGFSEMEEILKIGDGMLGLLFPSKESSRGGSNRLTEERSKEKESEPEQKKLFIDPGYTRDPEEEASHAMPKFVTDDEIPF